MEGLVNDLVSYAEAYFRDTKTEWEPPALDLLWDRFLEVHLWRGFDRATNMPNLLALDVIANWARLAEFEITQFELDVFMRLEGAFWEAMTPKGEGSSLFQDMKAIIDSEKQLRTVQVKPKDNK